MRDPETGQGARDPKLYRRWSTGSASSGVDVVLNLTAGMGGDLVLGGDETPLPPSAAAPTWSARPSGSPTCELLLPEICTLDCGIDELRVRRRLRHGQHARAMLRAMAKRVQELGVRPELEVFDTGHLVLVKELIRDGLLDDPVMIQLCMGIAYGAPDDPGTFMAMVNQLPPGAVFSAFSIGRMQLPFVAMAVLAGGNVRVGLEDNLYLGRGRAGHQRRSSCERAVTLLEAMNVARHEARGRARQAAADQAA